MKSPFHCLMKINFLLTFCVFMSCFRTLAVSFVSEFVCCCLVGVQVVVFFFPHCAGEAVRVEQYFYSLVDRHSMGRRGGCEQQNLAISRQTKQIPGISRIIVATELHSLRWHAQTCMNEQWSAAQTTGCGSTGLSVVVCSGRTFLLLVRFLSTHTSHTHSCTPLPSHRHSTPPPSPFPCFAALLAFVKARWTVTPSPHQLPPPPPLSASSKPGLQTLPVCCGRQKETRGWRSIKQQSRMVTGFSLGWDSSCAVNAEDVKSCAGVISFCRLLWQEEKTYHQQTSTQCREKYSAPRNVWAMHWMVQPPDPISPHTGRLRTWGEDMDIDLVI